MSSQTTLTAIRSAISSLASEDGPTLYALRDGPTIERFGQDRVHVSPSPLQGSTPAQTTNATSGHPSIHSSPPADLQSLWGNRLRQRLEKDGSTKCTRTWTVLATASGLQFSRLKVSALRTQENGFILFPTPAAQTQQGGMRIDGGSRSRAKWAAMGLMPHGKGDQVGISAWLMGFPPEWLSHAPEVSATQ